jgi:hypothetical protein
VPFSYNMRVNPSLRLRRRVVYAAGAVPHALAMFGNCDGIRADGISEVFGSTGRDSKFTCPRLATVFMAWYFSRQLLVVVIGFAGDGSEVPDESNGGEKLKSIVRQIDFPPIKSLSGTTPKLVMVVVPTFA